MLSLERQLVNQFDNVWITTRLSINIKVGTEVLVFKFILMVCSFTSSLSLSRKDYGQQLTSYDRIMLLLPFNRFLEQSLLFSVIPYLKYEN